MKYGSMLPADFILPPSSFWIKKDLTAEGNPFFDLPIQIGDKVMDCGAYAGTFAVACMEQGAASVTAYEAMPKTAAFLRGNLARYGERAEVVCAALVADNRTEATLHLSSFTGANTVATPKPGAKQIQVPSVCFRDALRVIRPTVLKLDLEGAEYDLLDTLQQGDLWSVRAAFVEFHPIDNQPERMRRCQEFIVSEGFEVVRSKKRSWTAVRKAA